MKAPSRSAMRTSSVVNRLFPTPASPETNRPLVVDGRQELTGIVGDRVRMASLAHGLLERDYVDVRRGSRIPGNALGVRMDELSAVRKFLEQIREVAPQRAARRLFIVVGKERERDRITRRGPPAVQDQVPEYVERLTRQGKLTQAVVREDPGLTEEGDADAHQSWLAAAWRPPLHVFPQRRPCSGLHRRHDRDGLAEPRHRN